MSYVVRISQSAEREMDRLASEVHDRISARILSLEKGPRPRGIKKLSNREEYSLRVGDYRVLYVIDDGNREVVVSAVGHRSSVYR